LIREKQKSGMPLENAVGDAVNYCMQNGIMRDFFPIYHPQTGAKRFSIEPCIKV
jgi:hypothetical protein